MIDNNQFNCINCDWFKCSNYNKDKNKKPKFYYFCRDIKDSVYYIATIKDKTEKFTVANQFFY